MATKSAVFESNFDDWKQILEFKQDFKTNIIQNGLDKPLKYSLEELKEILKDTINEKIKIPTSKSKKLKTTKEPKLRSTKEIQNPVLNKLGQKFISPPKSDAEIIKYATDGKTDITKYNGVKDFTTLSESNIAFSQDNRIILRMETFPGSSVEDQYLLAKDFFSKAIIGIPGDSGKINYYMNPGVDLTPYIKIKCSTITGDSDDKPKKGMSPYKRFGKAAKNNNYAQWTLKQSALDIIKNSFINLTPMMDRVKAGQVDLAKVELKGLDSKFGNKQLNDLNTKLDELESESPDVPESMQDYSRLISTINSMKILKKINDKVITYHLDISFNTSFSNDPTGEVSIEDKESVSDKISKSIRQWVGLHEDEWFQNLVKQTEDLIKVYTNSSTLRV